MEQMVTRELANGMTVTGTPSAIDAFENPPVSVPIDTSGTALAVVIRGFLFQIVGSLGVLVTVLGLSDSSYIGMAYRFLHADQVAPLLGVVAMVLASGWQLLRAVKKHRKFQTLGMLLPQRVAISPAVPTVAVERAALAAATLIDNPPGPVPAATKGSIL